MVNKWDISQQVTDRIPNINLGSSVIGSIVEESKVAIENYTGLSIDLSDIDSKFESALINQTAAGVMVNQLLADTDENIGVGNISINYRDKMASRNTALEFFNSKAEVEKRMLGKKMGFKEVERKV